MYAAPVPAQPTRRQVLGLGSVVAALAIGALSPALVRVHAGQRFTMVLARELPKRQRTIELDLAVERMRAGLAYVCVLTSVRRIGERIVFGIASEDADENQRLADDMLRHAEPIELRIATVDHGIVDIQLARERLLFH